MLSVSYVAVRADIDLSVCLSMRSINGYAASATWVEVRDIDG